MKKTQLKGPLILLLTAFIWGTSFVAQSVGMEKIEAFTFNGIRTLMGAAALIPFIVIQRIKEKKSCASPPPFVTKKLLLHGAIIGICLCVASNFQQQAFNFSSSGKIAFITAFYMLFVPVFGLFIGKKINIPMVAGVLVGAVGLYLLCIPANGIGEINKGDILSFICSIFFAIHILVVEKLADGYDSIKISFIQFAVSGAISCIIMTFTETPCLTDINNAILPLLYSGVMSCGAAFTLQIIGQKYTDATLAGILMCMESVFGVITGAIVLHERMSGRETIGCIIMFAAIIITQLLGFKQDEKKSDKSQKIQN